MLSTWFHGKAYVDEQFVSHVQPAYSTAQLHIHVFIPPYKPASRAQVPESVEEEGEGKDIKELLEV